MRDSNHGLRKYRNATHPAKPYILETGINQQGSQREDRPELDMSVIPERREMGVHLSSSDQS